MWLDLDMTLISHTSKYRAFFYSSRQAFHAVLLKPHLWIGFMIQKNQYFTIDIKDIKPNLIL